jgi:hypothetical protein
MARLPGGGGPGPGHPPVRAGPRRYRADPQGQAPADPDCPGKPAYSPRPDMRARQSRLLERAGAWTATPGLERSNVGRPVSPDVQGRLLVKRSVRSGHWRQEPAASLE